MKTFRIFSAWLVGNHDAPDQAREDWRKTGITLMPIGRAFDVVRLPEPLVQAALGTEGRSFAHSDFGLEESLGGPVIHDGHGRNYYAIVPPGTVTEWRASAPGAECLSHGTYLGVPATGILEYDATHPIYWATLGGASRFCDPASVSLLVRVGSVRLAEAEGDRQGAGGAAFDLHQLTLEVEASDAHPEGECARTHMLCRTCWKPAPIAIMYGGPMANCRVCCFAWAVHHDPELCWARSYPSDGDEEDILAGRVRALVPRLIAARAALGEIADTP
ncbi:hypothetical protein [Streptomyces sp. NPDC089915]|uniref:hypothetical protein n=1 Tax=Streptomyces sp. NPDC089915 TaxID=3155186 RepID=UPI0034178C55